MYNTVSLCMCDFLGLSERICRVYGTYSSSNHRLLYSYLHVARCMLNAIHRLKGTLKRKSDRAPFF